MMNISAIREKLKSETWTKDPFIILSEIANVCSSSIDLGRDLVIRALEGQDFLDQDYRNIPRFQVITAIHLRGEQIISPPHK
jgi:hypothetical protein